MTVIFYRDRYAAYVEGSLRYRPHIAVLEPDHPQRRFVAAMGLYALEVQAGTIPGPYCEQTAHAASRALLMPTEEFEPATDRLDAWLAEHFAVPLEQVAIRREEIALARLHDG